MRKIVLPGGVEVILQDTGVWTSQPPEIANMFNGLSDSDIRVISPAEGDFLTALFQRMTDRFSDCKATNDTPIIHPTEELVY